MLPAVLVACVSASAVAFTWRRRRVVTRLVPPSARAVRAAVASSDPAAIRESLSQLFPDEEDHAVMSRALVGGHSEGGAVDVANAVAALNERLGDVESALSRSERVPRVLGRAALASGTLAAVLELGASLSSGGGGAAWGPALSEFVAGVAGLVLTLEIERRSAACALQVRAGWDDVAGVLVSRWGGVTAGGPGPFRTRRPSPVAKGARKRARRPS